MARFDVYAHPDTALRRVTPFLLDVQNSHIELATRVVVPLRSASAFQMRMRDINPVFTIGGKEVVADTAALAAFPAADLKKPVANLRAESGEVSAALDSLFGAY